MVDLSEADGVNEEERGREAWSWWVQMSSGIAIRKPLRLSFGACVCEQALPPPPPHPPPPPPPPPPLRGRQLLVFSSDETAGPRKGMMHNSDSILEQKRLSLSWLRPR